MKKKWIWIVAAILIVLLIVLLIIPKKKLVSFDGMTFPETVMVTNGTEYPVDTITMILSHNVFEFDTIEVVVYYLPDQDEDSEIEFHGFVQKLPFHKHTYLILLNKSLSFDEVITTLSHEFIHIDQYERGDLTVFGKDYTWKGVPGTVTVYDTSLPFEVEAFNNQYRIKKELSKIIYE